MPTRDGGVYVRRTLSSLQRLTVQGLRNNFGSEFDVTNANPLKKAIDVGFGLPLDEMGQDLEVVYRSGFVQDAAGENLDKRLSPFGARRKLAARAKGLVEVTLNTGLESPPEPDPFIPAGSLQFTDSAGNRFSVYEDFSLLGRVRSAALLAGAVSETLQSAGSITGIAVPLTLTQRAAIGHVAVIANMVAGIPAFTVRIETSVAGQPSGVLAHENLELLEFIPVSGVETQAHFLECGTLPAGDYWVRLEITDGEATIKGSAIATSTVVKKLSGASWVDSTVVADICVSVFADLLLKVQSDQLGFAFNDPADSIVGSVIINPAITTRWNTNRSSFTNQSDMAGGRDYETDQEFRTRFIEEGAGSVSGTVDGIENAVREISDDATLIENTGDDAGTEDTLSSSAGFADTSETIGSGGITKIAWKFTMPRRSFLQWPTVKVAAASVGAQVRVRVETDAAGSPSGTLAAAALDRQLADVAVGDNLLAFLKPSQVLSGVDLWVTIEATTGTFSLNGTTSASPADQVKTFNGAWNLSALDQVYHSVVGGVPPHGYRSYVSGGDPDDIAQAQWDSRSAGIKPDGRYDGTATGNDDVEHVMPYDRPDFVPVVLHIELAKNPDPAIFSGDADSVRDAAVRHVGGVDTTLAVRSGLRLGKRLILDQLTKALLDQAVLPGSVNVPVLYAERKSIVALPGSLTSAHVLDLPTTPQEEFIIQDPTTDIEVVLSDEVE